MTDFERDYIVKVIGDEATVESFYSRLNVAAKDAKNVHLDIIQSSDCAVSIKFMPDLSPSSTAIMSQLDQQGHGVASKYTKRITFHVGVPNVIDPDVIIGVINSATDAAAANAYGATSPIKVEGPTSTVVERSEVLAHETCPIMVVDMATRGSQVDADSSFDQCATPLNRPPASVKDSDLVSSLSRKLGILNPTYFVGVVSFDELANNSDGLLVSDSASPTKINEDRQHVIDPASWITHMHNALTSPHYMIWDRDRACIRDDFVAHFRRCFWLLDQNRDGFLNSTSELKRAIDIMFGICTNEDLVEVLTILTEAEKEILQDCGTNEPSEQPTLVVQLDEAAYTEGADKVPNFKISESGFIQYLHSLLSFGSLHVKGIWYLLREFGHLPSQSGFVHSLDDVESLQRLRVRVASDVLHGLQELSENDLVADDDSTIKDGDQDAHKSKGCRLFLTSQVLQAQLSATGVSFFMSLFPSGPRVAHCKPAAFPSLRNMWDVIPPSFHVPWKGVNGMPQPEPWLDQWAELALDKKQGSRSYNTYIGPWRLENLYRFLECWEWAASGAVFIPTSKLGANTWWRQEAVVMFARQWGYRGDGSKLFTFRPTREFRVGRSTVDGFPRIVHVCLAGGLGSGKSSLARLLTFDGCQNNEFLAEDDEHDIPTEEENTDAAVEEPSRGSISVTSVTVDAHHLLDKPDVSTHDPAERLTVIFFYEVPADGQGRLFDVNASQSLPTDGAALWTLMNRPAVLSCMDLCLGLFDGTNALGFTQLADLWVNSTKDGKQSTSSLSKFWVASRRLPIVPVLTKADELPIGQVLADGGPDSVALYCSSNGLSWPPLITSAMSEVLHPQFGDAKNAPENAADNLNALIVQLAANPSAIVGIRVTRTERETEAAVERAAIFTRRVIVASIGLGIAAAVLKVALKVLKPKKGKR